MEGRTILLIDDEKDFCKLVKLNLEQISDFKIITAYNGKEGIDAARQNKPDLILLDIMMPVMDGLTALKILKEDFATMDIPVVMLTAKNDDLSRVKAIWSYSQDYIVKPIEATDLKNKIEAIIEKKKKK
ncbi:MAG: response regulator [Candidatus Omnitrophica bacterium]|nr:response regulator [Candidatus Omnitrophota bacterium]MDD5236083.1 response regulator [Candidatus Omnitrophota bacterium]MDD5611051.1 response regulator [Candidatus Omnitrophota bacterium]